MKKGNDVIKHVHLVSKILAANCEREGDPREMKIKINKARVAAGLPEKYETWYRGAKMISLAQLVDGSAENLSKSELQRLYQIADSDGDLLAIELIVKLLEKKKTPSVAADIGAN